MPSIKEIRQAIDSALDSAQAKAEAAQVQAALGKMELDQRLEGQCQELRDAASRLQEQLNEHLETEGSVGQRLQAAAENLRLQVALGAMDSEDALADLKRDLEGRVNEFHDALDDLDIDDVDDAVELVKERMDPYVRKVRELKSEIEARLERLVS